MVPFTPDKCPAVLAMLAPTFTVFPGTLDRCMAVQTRADLCTTVQTLAALTRETMILPALDQCPLRASP